MEIPLSPRAYRLVDGASKVVGLVAVTAALSGAAAPHSFLVGVLGVCVGVATVFFRPHGSTAADEGVTDGATDDRSGGPSRGPRPVTALARWLWRDRLARLGGLLWLVSFLVAGTGVVLRQTGSVRPAATLFAASGPVGLLGVFAVVAAGGREAVSALRA